MVRKSNNANASCPECYKSFGSESALEQHMWDTGHASFGLDPPFPDAKGKWVLK